MKRHASADWNGGLKNGAGQVSAESGAVRDLPYSYTTRFESERGSNPEELLGAAHASCYSMALAKELESKGYKPESIHSDAEVVLEKRNGGFSITKSNLRTQARVPGCSLNDFHQAAEAAKNGCLVSKVLNADITLHAELQQ